MHDISSNPEFAALRNVSARAGSDPLLVQAAGGNTSIKHKATMWIKASGTWLMHAERDDIFVPIDLPHLMEAFDRKDGSADKAQDFVVSQLNPSGLRPSIETTVHSVIPRDVVIHVHCVGTISIAVRQDAETVLAEKLSGLDWIFVPYVKPGVTLAQSIHAAIRLQTRVVILGNHGLVVAGDSVAEAEALMDEVHRRLTANPRPAPPHDIHSLAELAGSSGYVLPELDAAHGVATDEVALDFIRGGSLYPDHVIFLGVGSVVADDGESVADVLGRFSNRGLHEPVCIVFPRKGVLMSPQASPGAQALARCLSDVALRIPAKAQLKYLTAEENAELLNWDAEKYRQALNMWAEAPR